MDGKLVDLTAQWSTLMKQLGTDVLPGVNKSLAALIWVIEKVEKALSWSSAGHEASRGFSLLNYLSGGSGHDATPASSTSQRPIVVQSVLDGRVIAQSTTRYQIDGLAKMPATGNNFDFRASPYAPGY